MDDTSHHVERRASVKDRTTSFIAALYTIGYFAIIFLIIHVGIPQENRDALNTLLGMLSAAQLAIVGYYFGSSKGSDDKNATVLAAIKNQTDTKVDTPNS